MHARTNREIPGSNNYRISRDFSRTVSIVFHRGGARGECGGGRWRGTRGRGEPLANPYRSVVNSEVRRRWRKTERKKIADNGLRGYQDEQMAKVAFGQFTIPSNRTSALSVASVSRLPLPFPKRGPAWLVHEFFAVSFLRPGPASLHETRFRGGCKFRGPHRVIVASRGGVRSPPFR